VVNALRKIFKFSELPEEYFVKLPPLPPHYKELTPSLRQYFPIKHRAALPYIPEYKRKLADYYKIDDRIPDTYFDLPPKRKPLPSTYQELNPRVRSFFPFNPAISDIPLAEVVATLREYYTFKLLPNDYFSTKLPLPSDTNKIKTVSQFSFPITSDQEARKFLKQITPYYKFRLPLPEYIMQANPTDKPMLPKIDQIMEEFNIPIPIETPKDLVEAVKELRKHYYFTKLPEEWIQIPTNPPEEPLANSPHPKHLPQLPDNLPNLQTMLSELNIELSLPITSQQNIAPTMKTLRLHFKINSIPDFLLDLPPLPTPKWSIFKTHTQIRPASPSTVQSFASTSQISEELKDLNNDNDDTTKNHTSRPLENTTPMDTS
jgi:hypothetical protein